MLRNDVIKKMEAFSDVKIWISSTHLLKKKKKVLKDIFYHGLTPWSLPVQKSAVLDNVVLRRRLFLTKMFSPYSATSRVLRRERDLYSVVLTCPELAGRVYCLVYENRPASLQNSQAVIKHPYRHKLKDQRADSGWCGENLFFY